MNPDIQISKDQGITRITYRGQARFDLTTELIRETALIGFKNQSKLLLVDISEFIDPDYELNAVKHAEQASSLGIDPDFRIAFLGTQEDQRLPYLEKVAVDRGLRVKSFTNDSEAVTWLLENTKTES